MEMNRTGMDRCIFNRMKKVLTSKHSDATDVNSCWMIILYNVEAKTLNKKMENKTKVSEMMYRRICSTPWT